MQVADASDTETLPDTRHSQQLSSSHLAWKHLQLKPKSVKGLRELARGIREGRAVSALWSCESDQHAVQVACLLARDLACRVLHVRLQQPAEVCPQALEAQLDPLFDLAEAQGSILVLGDMDAMLCSRDPLNRRRFENYLMERFEQHQGVAIVVMPQHKRINPRLVRRLHFALSV